MVVAINERQMAALRAEAEARFRQRLIRWIGGNRDRVGRFDADPEECTRAVDEAIRLCDQAGVGAEDEVASIALRWLEARGQLWTERFAHVELILADAAIPADRKLEEIRLRETLALLAQENG